MKGLDYIGFTLSRRRNNAAEFMEPLSMVLITVEDNPAIRIHISEVPEFCKRLTEFALNHKEPGVS